MAANTTVIDHPLVQHKITLLRDKDTQPVIFRLLVREISQLMLYDATRDQKLVDREIKTPMTGMTAPVLADPRLVLVSIMRAGNVMLDAALELIPNAGVSHIGIYRDHDTLEAVEYYFNGPPDISERPVLIVDPMLATANSSVAAISRLKARGVHDMRMVNILAAPEGIAALDAAHPDVPLFVGAIDEHLNEKGYIIPGLGDAGDRSYAT
ncbi:MAG: uracil phosphoribosyltransferase [Alphaproteobacteria bacterium]|nr:uracil phosphoribosyltransferase [Alphaproteobacteria bacterium]